MKVKFLFIGIILSKYFSFDDMDINSLKLFFFFISAVEFWFFHIPVLSSKEHPEKMSINNNVIVGAMSFVNKDCMKNCTYFGIPARKIKKNKP